MATACGWQGRWEKGSSNETDWMDAFNALNAFNWWGSINGKTAHSSLQLRMVLTCKFHSQNSQTLEKTFSYIGEGFFLAYFECTVFFVLLGAIWTNSICLRILGCWNSGGNYEVDASSRNCQRKKKKIRTWHIGQDRWVDAKQSLNEYFLKDYFY